MAKNCPKMAKITTLVRQNDVKIAFLSREKNSQKFRKKYSYGIGYVIFCTFEFTRVKTANIANSYDFPIFPK